MGFADMAAQQIAIMGDVPTPPPIAFPGEEVHLRSMLTRDPLADLTTYRADTILWTRLLSLAYDVDPFFAATLHGFRCCGTRIVRRADGRGWRMWWGGAPVDGGWQSEADYEAAKAKWLVSNGEVLIGLLARLDG